METPPNTARRLPWPLRWLLLLAAVPRVSSHAPWPQSPPNSTLLFAGGAPGFHLRNCSCAAPVADCDRALAEARCRCHALPRSSLRPAGLRAAGQLVVWVTEAWLLEELLQRSHVTHLHLSFCGRRPASGQPLALAGLRSLRISAPAPEAPHSRQEVTVWASEPDAASSDVSSLLRWTLLDAALSNGLSALKAYTVVAPPTGALAQHFPHLPLPRTPPSDPGAEQNLLVTFVY